MVDFGGTQTGIS